MLPLTLEAPKPMIDVLGKPLLYHIIRTLPDEITEIVIVIGYKGDQIRQYFGDWFPAEGGSASGGEGRKITYIRQEKQIGNADALALCKPLLKSGERFLFMFCDDLHSPKAIKKLLSYELGTLVKEHPDPRRFGVFEVDANDRVISMEEKPEYPKSNLVAVGVYILDTRIFDYKVRKMVNGEYFMTDQIDQLIKDHKFVVERTDFWHPIGYPHDIDKAEELLRNRQHLSATDRRHIPLIILAGGRGTRMPAHEQDKPKVMVDIGGKPLLQHQLDLAMQQGFTNIRLALGYQAQSVIDWLKQDHMYSQFEYIVETKPLGTGGAIKLAAQGLKDPFIAINGDDIADVNYEGLVRHSSGGTYNVVTGMEIVDARAYGLIECDERKKICAFKEKDPSAAKGIVNIGHYYLKPEIFKDTPEVFSMERDIFPKLAERGELVMMKHMGNYWFGCGTPETLAATREYFSK